MTLTATGEGDAVQVASPAVAPLWSSAYTRAMKLTPKQLAFARAYAGKHRGNATQAAIEAGYAPGSAKVTGCRLLTNANVLQALSKMTEDDPLIASVERVQRRLSRMMDDPDVSEAGQIKAMDMILKTHGAYSQKVDVTADVQQETVIRIVRGRKPE